jgi:hypothetical protein
MRIRTSLIHLGYAWSLQELHVTNIGDKCDADPYEIGKWNIKLPEFLIRNRTGG